MRPLRFPAQAGTRSYPNFSLAPPVRAVYHSRMQNKKADGYRWAIAASGMLAIMAALGFGRFGYSMILPAMKEGLSLSEAQAGDLATANMLGYLAFSLLGGLLASRLGARRVVLASLVIVSFSLFLTGISPTYGWAFAARLLTGMAAGSVNVPVMGLLSTWFEKRERGLAGGLSVSGSSFGILIAGLMVPSLLGRFGPLGWRASWFALSALSLAVALLCSATLRDGASVTAQAGAGVKPGNPVPKPALRDIFARPLVWAIGGIYAFFGFSYIVYTTFFARALTADRGWDIAAAGRLWSTIGALSVASGFLWGAVSDKVGRKTGLAIVFTLQAASFSLLGLWNDQTGIWVSAAIFALTAWSIPAIVAAAAGDILGARLAPGALGFLTLFMGAGQVLGPLAGGRMASLSGSYAGAFILAGGVALSGAGLSVLLPGRKKG